MSKPGWVRDARISACWLLRRGREWLRSVDQMRVRIGEHVIGHQSYQTWPHQKNAEGQAAPLRWEIIGQQRPGRRGERSLADTDTRPRDGQGAKASRQAAGRSRHAPDRHATGNDGQPAARIDQSPDRHAEQDSCGLSRLCV